MSFPLCSKTSNATISISIIGPFLLFLIFISLLQPLSGQTPFPPWDLLSPAGAYLENSSSGIRLYSVVGQTAVSTQLAEGVSLHQGFLQSSWVIVSTEEVSIEPGWLQVAPNPVAEELLIETSVPLPLTLRLYDVQGRLVDQYEVISHRQRIKLGELPAGPYFLNAYSSEQGQLPIVKILKVR